MLTCEQSRDRRAIDILHVLEQDGKALVRSSTLHSKSVTELANAVLTSHVFDSTTGSHVYLSLPTRLQRVRQVLMADMVSGGRPADDEEIWRVKIEAHKVSALYIGLDSKPAFEAPDMSGLPQWMQERVAVLAMLTQAPPTKPIPGVGRRITESVYWIVH
jgi:hypothetical protein